MIKHAQGEFYETPVVKAIEITPTQIVCGSIESIVPDPETDWVMGYENLFDSII